VFVKTNLLKKNRNKIADPTGFLLFLRINFFNMITTTTPGIEGRTIEQYYGVISAEVIIGANVFKDILGGLRDFFGGRSGTYEKVLDEAKQNAMQELVEKAQALGANAVVGIDLDFETVGSNGSMLMVVATGTAVRFS
jgi:uncharacterized protein YbjQ (UPF0145 family)